MAIFGKEALDAWPVRDIEQDIVAKRAPIDNTIGYEVCLMHRFDDRGDVVDTYLDINVSRGILRAEGFDDLRKKVIGAINRRRDISSIDISPSEVVENGEYKEHVIFEIEKQSSFDSSKLAKR
ncbi:MAG: hypothetical protein AAB531_02635 [Patescibacteria group bacterium]